VFREIDGLQAFRVMHCMVQVHALVLGTCTRSSHYSTVQNLLAAAERDAGLPVV
jgi:hypothetical protein